MEGIESMQYIQVKQELIDILKDYRETMSKDLEQALTNIVSDMEGDPCKICGKELGHKTYYNQSGQVSSTWRCYNCE